MISHTLGWVQKSECEYSALTYTVKDGFQGKGSHGAGRYHGTKHWEKQYLIEGVLFVCLICLNCFSRRETNATGKT